MLSNDAIAKAAIVKLLERRLYTQPELIRQMRLGTEIVRSKTSLSTSDFEDFMVHGDTEEFAYHSMILMGIRNGTSSDPDPNDSYLLIQNIWYHKYFLEMSYSNMKLFEPQICFVNTAVRYRNGKQHSSVCGNSIRSCQ